MKHSLLWRRLVICLVFIGLLLACHAPKSQDSATEQETVPETAVSADDQIEQSKPDRAFKFTTTDLNGEPVDDSLFDQYDLIMLNYWAYWCQPCVREIPELEQLHQNYPNVLLLGVIVDDSDMGATLSILENADVTYPVVYPQGDLEKLARNCQYIPTTFFLKPNGLMLGEPVVGSNDLSRWTKIVEGNLK